MNGATSAAYTYDTVHPHAVKTAFGYNLTYDGNGNLLTRVKANDNSYVKGTGFDKPRWMAKTTATLGGTAIAAVGSEFHYNANRSRTMQLEFTEATNAGPTKYNRKRLYALGSTLELNYTTTTPALSPTWTLDTVRIYVPGPDGIIGAREFRPSAGGAEKTLVYHYDHLGSITAITNYGTATLAADPGGKTGRFSEDAWGQRRNPTTWSGAPTAATDDGGYDSLTPRGYTGHEMLDNLGLVHMNGRIYDPLLGRMLSADIVVQAPGDLQSYNRYSYVRNNPLTLIDPSGFLDETAFGRQLARWGSAGGDFLGEMEGQSAKGWTYKSFTSDSLNASVGNGTVGGVTSRGNTTIFVQDKSSMRDTIDSTVHETEHSTQKGHTTIGERKNNERGAYRKEAKFQIDTGRSSEFTKREKSKSTGDYEERIDDAAIESHLTAHYPNPVGKDGKPLSDSHAASSGTMTDANFNGVEVVDVHMVRLAYDADASKAAAKAAKQEAKKAESAAKKASPEQRAEAQKTAAEARSKADQAEASAKQANEAAEQERKRLKQTRGY